MTTVYIGLGSNLDNPIEQVRKAVSELSNIQDTALNRVSSLYGSEPVGPRDQPEYVNAVVEMETELEPEQLLIELFSIEDRHRRKRLRQWGPRTLDLDLLLYGDLIMKSDALTIPHPEMHKRSFVLFPLLEIAPEIVIPGIGAAVESTKGIDLHSLTRLEEA